jgi:arogenate dehydrogenase (NADP+), plant
MVELSCEDHDQQAANTQFITHTVGRMLSEMNVQSTTINTRGYESLLNLVHNTAHDSFDLYYGLFMYNQVGVCRCFRVHFCHAELLYQGMIA